MCTVHVHAYSDNAEKIPFEKYSEYTNIISTSYIVKNQYSYSMISR